MWKITNISINARAGIYDSKGLHDLGPGKSILVDRKPEESTILKIEESETEESGRRKIRRVD